MLPKQIKFTATDLNMLDIWPHPKPASHFIPKEYRNLERYAKGNFHSPTVKVCVPFLDSMTAGYIIPFDQDYLIDPVEKEFSVTAASRKDQDIGYHDKAQLPKEWHEKAGEHAGKFINKWLIKTPPGYSCLFTQPLNRYGEKRIQVIDGIVDTDTYINTVHFPFMLFKRDRQFILKKGDPMVQVIPFKRESWKMWSGFIYEPGHSKTLGLLMSVFLNRYKSLFWNKKSFK
jgi:hypothetical protein